MNCAANLGTIEDVQVKVEYISVKLDTLIEELQEFLNYILYNLPHRGK